jgi:hypothetical protein
MGELCWTLAAYKRALAIGYNRQAVESEPSSSLHPLSERHRKIIIEFV